MNRCQPPFTVDSKIYKDTQSSNPNEPTQRIIKVVITLNDQNSIESPQDNSHPNLNRDYSNIETIKPVLTISSSYVRESPPHNLPKKTTVLQKKPKLVEQITQFEEKIGPDDIECETQPPHRSLGPPAFNSPPYKKLFNSDKSKENEDYNSNSDNFTDLSPKNKKADLRKKKANIFSRTSRVINENSQLSSIKQEEDFKIPDNFVQIKREDKNKHDFSYTQKMNSKKTTQNTTQNTYQKQNQNQTQTQYQYQKRYQYQKQDYFYENDSNNVIDEAPKVPIIFRSHKSHKAPVKNKPYFSTSTLPIEPVKHEKFEKSKKIERDGKKLNRKILRIPTVNDDLPIFHEDPPEVSNSKQIIDQKEEPLFVEEEEIQDENDKVISFAPSTDDHQNHDNIRRKIDFSNSPLTNKKENAQLENMNPNSLNQKEELNKFDFNDSNEEEDLLVSDDEDIDIIDYSKFNKNENYQNKNGQSNYNNQNTKFNFNDIDENEEYNNLNTNHLPENKSANKATNLVIEPIELNTNINKLYQQNRFSKIENQLIFEENPDEEFDQNKIVDDQLNIMKPPISTTKPTNLTFNNQKILNIQSEKDQEKQASSSKPINNEKVINVTFDDILPDDNKNNFENSQETIDQTQTVISSDIKSGVSINFSPIKKIENEEMLNDEENQVSSLTTKENDDKKDDNFWMFIPIDKKKRKKEINITQNMSKVVNVSRNYVKGVQAFRSLSMLLNQHRYEHFVMNLDKENQKLIGIYTLNDRMNQIKKIWGDGPEKATLDDVNSSLLYNPSSKKFSNVDPSFTQDIDAVYLK